MKKETREVYKCEYCGKWYLRKHACEYHERMCFKNPDTHRPCFECEHLTKDRTIINTVYYDEECEMQVELFHCNAKKTFLYTPKNQVKNNWFRSDDIINNPMPRECDLQKVSKIYDDTF